MYKSILVIGIIDTRNQFLGLTVLVL